MEKKAKIIIISAASLVVLLLIAYYFLFFKVDLKYKKEIVIADKYFTENKFIEAKPLYENAIKLKSNEEYPKNQLEKVKDQLKIQVEQKKYKGVIAEADQLYQQSDFEKAKEKYTLASEIIPAEQYPKDKIGEIDRILSKLSEKALMKSNEYHIIIGCFMVENNAIRMNEKLINNGNYSKIFPINDGRFNAVSYSSHSSLKDAVNELPQVKSGFNEEAWVLHRRQ